METTAKNKMESTLQLLKADLDRYAAMPGANKKAVNIRLQRLNELIDANNKAEAYIQRLEEEVQAASIKNHELQRTIKMLEAVCLIHGVDDFPAWLQKGLEHLVQIAVEQNKKGMATTPRAILESMSDDEKSQFFAGPTWYDKQLEKLIAEYKGIEQ